MKHHLILRVATKLLVPPIILFALYVQFHGDFGPGGGFQAGVIIGAAFVLYSMVFGLDAARAVAPVPVIRVLVALGFLIYMSVGFFSLSQGAVFLDYDVLAHDPHHGQHYGILLVEFGVGMTVAATMIAIFYFFAGRRAPTDEGDQ